MKQITINADMWSSDNFIVDLNMGEKRYIMDSDPLQTIFNESVYPKNNFMSIR